MFKNLLITSAILAGLAWLGLPQISLAHPHAFVETRLSVVFDKKGLSGFKVNWVLDEMFSALMIEEFDKDKNGQLSSAEVNDLKQSGFSNLKNFSYFTHIKINGRKFDIKWVKKFHAKIHQQKLVYKFEIPCHVKAGKAPKNVSIGVFDSTYYTDMYLAEKDPVILQSPRNLKSGFTITQDHKNKIYFGMVSPVLVKISFSR